MLSFLLAIATASAGQKTCSVAEFPVHVAKVWQIVDTGTPAAKAKEGPSQVFKVGEKPSPDVPGKTDSYTITVTSDPNWIVLTVWLWGEKDGKTYDIPLPVQMDRQGNLRLLGWSCEESRNFALELFSYLKTGGSP